MEMTKKDVYIGAGAVAVIAVSIVLLSGGRGGSFGSFSGDLASSTGEDGELVIPAMTAVMEQVLEKSGGFQLLVSYTDEGFEPSHASIKAGDTVRFTNNSSRELWVSAAAVHSGAIYHGSQASCGQSDFDSCARLKPYEFWEFTFEEGGVWGFRNAAYVEDEAALEVI